MLIVNQLSVYILRVDVSTVTVPTTVPIPVPTTDPITTTTETPVSTTLASNLKLVNWETVYILAGSILVLGEYTFYVSMYSKTNDVRDIINCNV